MTKNKVSLCMVIHSHQPVGNFDHVIEEAYQKCYLPFLQTLARHPRIALSLHYSGILWAWIEAHHPEFIGLVRELTDRGQVEHVGGGYFEPILVAIPDAAKVAQIRRLREYLTDTFSITPRGVWVTERVWEQGLILPLAKAGAEYTVLDDSHFLATGEDPANLHQAFLTEESGVPLKLVPSLETLRYTIPFRDPEETLSILRQGFDAGRTLFAVGDDCEKFGVWPDTYEHCYTDRWLERFFQAIERESGWLEAATLSTFLTAHPPTRRIYLPTASYSEMMKWALRAAAGEDFAKCLEAAKATPGGAPWRRFLRGAPWRNFLCKYPESNQFQKLMIRTYERLETARHAGAAAPPEARSLAEAEEHLLASQCNDAYWHGFFGGLYAPHLRSAIERHLIQAESILDSFDPAGAKTQITVEDFDVDGCEELLVSSPGMGIVIRPADGGTISSLRSKVVGAELVNSLVRRPEAYHRLVREKAEQRTITGQAASPHLQTGGKETDLAALLRYDRYARHAFRSYLFSQQKTCRDFEELRLEECAELAQGSWDVMETSETPCRIRLQKRVEGCASGSEINLDATKSFAMQSKDGAWELHCQHKLSIDGLVAGPWTLGVEIVLNLLAPDSPDRYFRVGEERHRLQFKGELQGEKIALVDEWQRIEITLTAPSVARWWIAPIETISQSESGFERIYQGSAILAVWNTGLAAGAPRSYDLQMRVRSLHA
ncbi:MAG TPA: alpha-amylase/4-alpha-glucanotransferase domain-containing protein [Terriglobia bacterium]|nr:alpha-amylase/4-alpha-glucanotransferase domain-containing protein [Terriglobia bacterium]